MDIVDRVTQWLLDRESERKSKVREFLVLVEDLCQELVDLEDGRSERAKFLQHKARAFYDKASMMVGGKLSEDDLETVVTALGEARIYCWIRYMGDSSESREARRLRAEAIPLEPYPRVGGWGSASLAELVRRLADGLTLDPGVQDHVLEIVRSDCLASMARVSVLRARL